MNGDLPIRTGSWQRSLVVLAIGFLPLFVFWTCAYIIWPWHYYDCFDPEGIHFACGLHILNGHGPENVDNPATPLQFLSAILCWLSGCGILDMESFRPIAYSVTIVLRIVAAYVLVRYVFRDLPATWQVALIWIPWLAPDFMMMSRQWCPETLYFPLGILAVVLLYNCLNDASHWRNAWLAGAAIGVMIGVKFIFVAWAAAAFLAIAISLRPVAGAKSCLALGAGVLSGFVVATLPAITRYPRMFEWLYGLATKTGQYGSGSSGFMNLELAGTNMVEVITHQKTWSLLVTIVVILLVLRKPRTTLAIFCALAIAGSYALTLKHFAPRYLAPTGLLLLLAISELLRDSGLRTMKWAGPCAFVVVGFLMVKALALDVNLHRTFVSERRESERALNELLEEQGRTPQSVILYGWRAFVPAFTVRFLNQGDLHPFDREIDSAFPCEGLFNGWPDHLELPPGKSSWDFIVVGSDFETFIDAESLNSLRQKYPHWVVDRYNVFKNDHRLSSMNQVRD